MRHTLVKLAGLMLAVMLVLTGCNLIGVDPMLQLDEDFAKLDKDYATVVAEYDGGTVTKGDVLGLFNSEYNYYYQMYSMFGVNMSADDVADQVRQDVVEDAVRSVAVDKALAARSVELTEEKLAEVQTQADEDWQSAWDSFAESADSKDEAVRNRQIEYNMYTYGYTKDMIYNSHLNSAKYELMEETVEGDVESLSDEELQTAYEAKVAEDEETYADNAGSFESAMTNADSLVAWIPEGYRIVKHILLKPEEDVLNAVTDARSAYTSAQSTLEGFESELDALNDDDAADENTDDTAEDAEPARDAAAIQADIDEASAGVDAAKVALEAAEKACIDSVQDKLDEINAKLEAGESFDSLIEAFGEDPGMTNEPTASRGYYVSANSTNWDQSFTDGAMALANVGDVSEPIVGASGVHIIRYESDAPAGAVALEDIHDAMYDHALEEARHQHFSDELTAAIDALHPVYHLDAFVVG